MQPDGSSSWLVQATRGATPPGTGLAPVTGDGKFVDVPAPSPPDYKFKVIINGKSELERSHLNPAAWVPELNYRSLSSRCNLEPDGTTFGWSPISPGPR
jgi:hypothetical protein